LTRRGGARRYVTERGRRVARIVPVAPPLGRRQAGSAKGLIAMADDFDETPEDFAEYLE
jgi:antitoxin (DNA-binding transcriptional repressor) of toxin-antitoxin stability system